MGRWRGLAVVAVALLVARCGAEPWPPDGGSIDAGTDAGTDAGRCGGGSWPQPPCSGSSLEERLRCIPGLNISAVHDAGAWPLFPAGYTRFSLTFTQPVDHDRPDAGSFQQRVTLAHVDPTRPLVLATTGYDLFTFAEEPTRMFAANQLMYEHRFFTPSRPAPADWSKLDIRQAAMDAHRLSEAFHWLYPGPWLNTGVSKGGMTSLYHRRFHPCDVDATVAYVAPGSQAVTDPAYPTWLDSVGGATWAPCRQAWRDFQVRCMQQRGALEPMLGGGYSRLGPDKVFELVVVEANFQFWQYTSPGDSTWGCGAIPGAGATPAQLWSFLSHHGTPAELASDQALAALEPYYHQAAAQLGAPAPFELPIAGLQLYPGLDVTSTYLPPTNVPSFDPSAMFDVSDWLHTDGERVLFVYGEYDPWSARKYGLGQARDSFVFIQPGGNHTARIGLLSAADKAAAVRALERWMGRAVTVQPNVRAEDELELPRWPL